MADKPLAFAGAPLGPVIYRAGSGVVRGLITLTSAFKCPISTQEQPLWEHLGREKDVKLGTKEDGRRVLKLSDAIECVESTVNGGIVGRIITNVIQDLLAGAPVTKSKFDVANPIILCMRSKVLQQNNPIVKFTSYHGHRTKGG